MGRRWWGWWRRDLVIDGLLTANAATPRPGMERPDLAIITKIGKARWDQTAKAQERIYDRPHP